MLAGIADLSNKVLNQLRKACAAAAASGGGSGGVNSGELAAQSTDGFPDLDNFYGGDRGPSIRSLMEVREGKRVK